MLDVKMIFFHIIMESFLFALFLEFFFIKKFYFMNSVIHRFRFNKMVRIYQIKSKGNEINISISALAQLFENNHYFIINFLSC
jgi:hypothetical protein